MILQKKGVQYIYFDILEDGIDENYGVAVQFDEDEEEVNTSKLYHVLCISV